MTATNPFRFEAETRLIRWGESSSAGRTITLELPPDDGAAHPFRGFPTGHSHGQRFRMQFDAIADDEQTNSPAGAPPTPPQPNNRKDITAAAEPDGKARSPTDATAPAGEHNRYAPTGEAQRQRYAAMSPAEQAVVRAALLAKDKRFRAWLTAKYYQGTSIVDEDVAAHAIRSICCDCDSRKLIGEVPEYMDRFLTMETEFKMDVGELPRPR